jgi:hypothetical protein
MYLAGSHRALRFADYADHLAHNRLNIEFQLNTEFQLNAESQPSAEFQPRIKK